MTEYQPFYNNSYALVIGIDDYDHPGFVPLGEAEENARQIAKRLSEDPYNFRVKTLIGEDATQQNILQALFMLRETDPDDRILVYFAGHGYTLSDRWETQTGYLATVDTVPDQDFTALKIDAVTDLRRNANAKHIAFVFDACFSGQALGLTRSAAVAAEKFLERRAYQVISAGAGDQEVADFDSMTERLMGVLNDGLPDSPDLVTLGGLGLYLQRSMASDSNHEQIPQFGHLQGSQGGEFILLQHVGPTLPRDLERALRSDLQSMRLGAVNALIEIASADDDALKTLATERLERVRDEDNEKAVRTAARAYFEKKDEIEKSRAPTAKGRKAKEIVDSALKLLEEEDPAAFPTPAPIPQWESPDTEPISSDRLKDARAAMLELEAEAAEQPQEEEKPPPAESGKATADVPAADTTSSPRKTEDLTAVPERTAAIPAAREAIDTKRQPSALLIGGGLAGLGLLVLLIGAVVLGPRLFGAASVEPTETVEAATVEPTNTSPPPTKTPEPPTATPTEAPAVVEDPAPEEVVPTATLTPAPTVTGGGGPLVAYVSSLDGDADIYLLDLVTREVTNLTNNDVRDNQPVWSPDGTRIAFTSVRDGDDEIYVVEVATGSITQLTDNGVSDFEPVWSPDSTQIAYISLASGFNDIWVTAADGSGSPQQLTSGESNSGLAWSPTGDVIAYFGQNADDGPGEIYSITPDGITTRTLATSPEGDFAPAWSLDGSQIVFFSVREDINREIYVMEPDGTNITRLTFNNVRDQDPVFSPDGSQIAFVREAAGSLPEVWIMDATGENEQLIGQGEQPAWSPDGTQLIYNARLGDVRNLVLVQLERLTFEQLTVDGFVSSPIWQPN